MQWRSRVGLTGLLENGLSLPFPSPAVKCRQAENFVNAKRKRLQERKCAPPQPRQKTSVETARKSETISCRQATYNKNCIRDIQDHKNKFEMRRTPTYSSLGKNSHILHGGLLQWSFRKIETMRTLASQTALVSGSKHRASRCGDLGYDPPEKN